MPHFVFANNNEIAAKSAQGISAACSPDVCFSPGPPPPGVPVPYPNTAKSGDLDNLSRTVFFKGTGGALEKDSYFATSYGNEPATPGLKKGTISSQIKGKAHFATWSLNVKVEGKGVARHMDTVTHNHNSPPNALVQKYRSVFNNDSDCSQDKQQVESKCKEKPAPADDKKPKPKKRSIGKTLENVLEFPDHMAQDLYGYKRRAGENAWVEDHCAGMWIKPANRADAFKKVKARLDQIDALLKKNKLSAALEIFDDLKKVAAEKLGADYVASKVGWLTARTVGKQLVGLLGDEFAGAGTVAATAWSLTDMVSTAAELAEKAGPEALEILKDLKDIDGLKKKAQEKLADYVKNPQKAWADMMSAKAQIDPCLRARKCMLVPFNKTGAKTAANSGQGCCPGQTGHHVIPGAAFDGNSCYSSIDHRNAPTICVEGVNNSHGTHGLAHRELQQRIEAYKDKHGDAISYKDQRDKSVDAIRASGAGHCDRECLIKQLDAYYKSCNKGNEKNLKAHSGMGGSEAEESATNEISND